MLFQIFNNFTLLILRCITKYNENRENGCVGANLAWMRAHYMEKYKIGWTDGHYQTYCHPATWSINIHLR